MSAARDPSAAAAPQPPRPSLAGWRPMISLMWKAGRWRVALYAVLVLVAGLLPTAVILLMGRLVGAIPGAVANGLQSADGERAAWALGLLLGVLVLIALVSAGLRYLCFWLDTAYLLEVQRAVAAVTLGTPGIAPLEDPALVDELDAVRQAERRGILRGTASVVSSLAVTRLRGAGGFVVLLGFAWWAPLLLAAAWHLTNRVYWKSTQTGVSVQMNDGAVRLRRAEYLRSLAVEAPAAKELRVFGLGGWLVGGYGDAWMEAMGIMWRSRGASRGLSVAAVAALVVSHTVVLGALAAAALRGDMGVAALLVFVQAAITTSDLGLLGESQWFLAQALAVADRVARVGTRAPPPAQLARRASGGGAVGVRLENVTFTYRGRDRPTLDGLALEIPAGQSLAVVGENGAGKSTLVKLLCGLYEPGGGRVVLDGGATPLESRGRIAAIFQDFVRYPLSLRENVGFGHAPLMNDDAALEAALRDAGGAQLFAALPHGWSTVLSRELRGGAELSGGQWQRVALARALAAVRGGAGLLILDEPTAALDVRAETELFERFLRVTRGITTVLVSHRLSSVRHADRIVVIDGGRVAEDGTHDALVRAGGRYARMYALQAERFAGAAAGAEGAHA
jgi:ATP-binding cassette subfamily B protein